MQKFSLSIFLILLWLGPTASTAQLMQDEAYQKNSIIITNQTIEPTPNSLVAIQPNEENIFADQMEDSSKITKEPLSRIEARGKKSPALAFTLSFLFPGVGQYYNGDYAKGVIQDVFYISGCIVALRGGLTISGGDIPIETTSEFWAGAGIACGAWLWSMIDAPISACKINRQRKQLGYGHLMELNKNGNIIGLDMALMKQRIEVGLSIHF